MINMAHCRFENTCAALKECCRNNPENKTEEQYKQKLLKLCALLLESEGYTVEEPE